MLQNHALSNYRFGFCGLNCSVQCGAGRDVGFACGAGADRYPLLDYGTGRLRLYHASAGL